MIVENQIVKMKWNGKNKKFYESKGYIFTYNGDEIDVGVSDISDGSHILVEYVCDYCFGKHQLWERNRFKPYSALLKQRKTINKDCCNNSECSSKKMQESWLLNLKNNNETLGDKFPQLMIEWSKNNNKTPYEFSYGSKREVWWICNKGHEWKASILRRTLGESSCPYCTGRKAGEDNCLTTLYPELTKEWNWQKNKGLSPLDVTKGSHKLVWWLGECGHEWKAQVKSRTILNSGCPTCSESKGEKKIYEYLKINNVYFKTQWEFFGLVGINGGNLRFDFAILNNLNVPIFIIEYDGEFHYEKRYDGDGHEQIVEHDKRKNRYCKENNIPLLRIPYWEFNNIEEILDKELITNNMD